MDNFYGIHNILIFLFFGMGIIIQFQDKGFTLSIPLENFNNNVGFTTYEFLENTTAGGLMFSTEKLFTNAATSTEIITKVDDENTRHSITDPPESITSPVIPIEPVELTTDFEKTTLDNAELMDTTKYLSTLAATTEVVTQDSVPTEEGLHDDGSHSTDRIDRAETTSNKELFFTTTLATTEESIQLPSTAEYENKFQEIKTTENPTPGFSNHPENLKSAQTHLEISVLIVIVQCLSVYIIV